MKKIAPLLLIIFALIAYIVFSKGSNNYDIESAKQALETGTNSSQTINAWDKVVAAEKNNAAIISELSNIIAEWPNYIIEKVTNEQYITLTESVLQTANYDGKTEIAITGNADLNVESIQFDFKNTNSEFPDDFYPLQNFSAWKAPFTYRASPKYKVLDSGENIYLITAKTANWESKTKLTITADKETITEREEVKETEDTTPVVISGSINDLKFPKGNFWEVIISNDTTAFYSDLKWLEISKAGWLTSTVCEAPQARDGEVPDHSITKFLWNRFGYWIRPKEFQKKIDGFRLIDWFKRVSR